MLNGTFKPTWFTLLFPVHMTFEALHDAIMNCSNWCNSHLYDFYLPDIKSVVKAMDEEDGDCCNDTDYRGNKLYHAAFTKASELLDGLIKRKLVYSYDYGDGWECDIKVVSVIDDYPYGYPTVNAGDGPWPPEDCGGVGGFEDILRLLNKRIGDKLTNEEDELLEWLDTTDFYDFDINCINEMFEEFFDD